MAISAVGDTLSVAGSSGTSNIQPPSGEVWNVTALGFGPGQVADEGRFEHYDGTDVSRSVLAQAVEGSTAPSSTDATHMANILTNSQYGRLANAAAAAQAMSYRGVKL